MRERPKLFNIDGVVGRSQEQERTLNGAFKECFQTPAGETVMEYLRQMVGQVCGPEASDGQIRHLEGQRFLFALIDRRIENGKRGLPK